MDDFMADEIFELLPQYGFNGTESGTMDFELSLKINRRVEGVVS
jgi:hypothetical protein